MLVLMGGTLMVSAPIMMVGGIVMALREDVGLSWLVAVAVPHDAPHVIARLHAVGQVVERDYSGEVAKFRVRLPPHLRAEFQSFIVAEAA